MNKSVGEIAELVGGAVVGDRSVRITGLNGIKQAVEGDLTFVGSPRYLSFVEKTRASAVLVTHDVVKASKPLIQVPDPYAAFALVLQDCQPAPPSHPRGIHPTAALGAGVQLGRDVAIGPHTVVADSAILGDRVILHAGVYVGAGSTIGDDTLIYPHVTVRERVTIGARCILHSGVVVGSDGFGFSATNGVHKKIPQVGTVVIGDDVEIGANSAVDRATFGMTRIGSGTKIDNLVQIGHNVEIGQHCIISGMSGVAGSATIGNAVIIGAQAGVSGHLEIGDGAVIAARSGVVKSIPPGETVSGFPAIAHGREKRIRASERRLPELLSQVRELTRRIAELEERLHGKAEDDR